MTDKVGGQFSSLSSAMTELANAFRGFFKLTDPLSIQDMTTCLKANTITECELLSKPWSQNGPLNYATVPINPVPPVFLSPDKLVEITIDFKNGRGAAFNLSVFDHTDRYTSDYYNGEFRYINTVKGSQLDNLKITLNTGQWDTFSVTSVKLKLLS